MEIQKKDGTWVKYTEGMMPAEQLEELKRAGRVRQPAKQPAAPASKPQAMPPLDIPPTPVPQDATNPEAIDIKGGSIGPNPLMTAASFVAPLAVDEFETHGASRPGILAAKGAGDAAMMAIPATKAVGAGMKVGGALTRRAGLEAAGTRMLTPWHSARASERIAGQAAANAADNVLYTGIQQAVDNRERTAGDVLAELGISTVLGGGTGAAGGARSYGNTLEHRQFIFNKTKAREGTKKDEVFDRIGRFDADHLSNADQANRLIATHPAARWGGPRLWEDINGDYDRAINAKLNEVRTLARDPAGQYGNTYNFGNNVEFRGVPLERPRAFQNARDLNRYQNDVRNFMETNNLGTVANDIVLFNDGVLQADVEAALRAVNTGTLPTAHQQNWKSGLMNSLKGGDRGNRAEGARTTFAELVTPSNDFNEAMRDLEKLRSYRQVLNYASGGMGFGIAPNRYGIFSSFNRQSRPAVGLQDFDLEVIPRNITQGAANAYDRRGDIDYFLNAARNFGEASPEAREAYKNLSLEAKNAAAKIMNEQQFGKEASKLPISLRKQ
jgi:hypothetical protein